MERMRAYGRYWKKHPPTHMAAGFMGYEAPKQVGFEQFAGALGIPLPPEMKVANGIFLKCGFCPLRRLSR